MRSLINWFALQFLMKTLTKRHCILKSEQKETSQKINKMNLMVSRKLNRNGMLFICSNTTRSESKKISQVSMEQCVLPHKTTFCARKEIMQFQFGVLFSFLHFQKSMMSHQQIQMMEKRCSNSDKTLLMPNKLQGQARKQLNQLHQAKKPQVLLMLWSMNQDFRTCYHLKWMFAEILACLFLCKCIRR